MASHRAGELEWAAKTVGAAAREIGVVASARTLAQAA
jgi:hypothetical protein